MRCECYRASFNGAANSPCIMNYLLLKVSDMVRVAVDRSGSSRLYRSRPDIAILRRHHPDRNSDFSET